MPGRPSDSRSRVTGGVITPRSSAISGSSPSASRAASNGARPGPRFQEPETANSASAQSEKVVSRDVLEKAMAQARARHGDNPRRPPHWGGYRVTPHEIEFWQGRSDRLHDRLRYRRSASSPENRWTIERLSP